MAKSKKPKSPRRWRRRFLWAFAVLLVIGVLSPLLVALPPVRNAIADKVGTMLGRKVEIDSAFAFWGRGVELEGITVHSPDGFSGPLATVKKIHADVDVLKLFGGSLSAAVRVLEPHITYRRNALDQGNADGVMENLAGEEPKETKSSDASMDLSVVVIGGRVEAPDEAAGEVIDDIQATMKLDTAGRTTLSVRGIARGAGRDGKDAPFKSDVAVDARGEGPIEIEAPAVELARIAGILEGATGLRKLGGILEVTGKGKLLADGTLEGRFQCSIEDLRVATNDGVALTLRRLRGRTQLTSENGSTASKTTIALGDLRVREQDREVYREPNITFTADARFDPNAGTARISQARLDAGRTAAAQVQEPLRIETNPAVRMAGKAFLRVDLGRLGHLHALVPALKALGAGTLDAHVDGRSGTGVDVGTVITVTGLRLEPSDIAPEGYAERRMVFAFAGGHDSGVTTVNFERIESALLRGTLGDNKRPMQLQIDADGRWGLDGAFDLILDLPSLSRLLGTEALGLERGERLAGVVRVKGNARGNANEMQLGAGIGAGGIRFPPSWGTGSQAGTLQGTFKLNTEANGGRFQLDKLTGMGLTVSATAELDRSTGETKLANAEADVTGDLARVRPFFGGKLGVSPTGQLAGQLRGVVRVVDQGETMRVVTEQLAATNVIWRKDAASRPVQQARVQLDADVRLGEAPRPHLLDVLTLTAVGIEADLSGASLALEPDMATDGTLRLAGDAGKLAPVLSAALGEGYEDLKGSGPISGSLRLKGSMAEHGRQFLVEGTLGLATWSTGGLTLADVRLELVRPGTAAPLAATLSSVINGGRSRLGATFSLGAPTTPWQGKLDVQGADTSTIVLSSGLGRYLAFAFPALLPAQTNQPVLSGRLVADVQASSTDIASPALTDRLTGRGSVAMRQGEIKQSTLFGGRSNKLTRVVGMLRTAVPEAGSVLYEISKSVTFVSLDSQFNIANRIVNLERATLRGRRVNVDMKGRVDFDARVALDANTTVLGSAGRELAKVVPNAVIPLRISGTLEDPRVVPNVDIKRIVGGGVVEKLPGLIDEIRKKGPELPKPPKLPKLPNPFK